METFTKKKKFIYDKYGKYVDLHQLRVYIKNKREFKVVEKCNLGTTHDITKNILKQLIVGGNK